MRMLIFLVLGIGGFAAAVIFCDPLRAELEKVLFTEQQGQDQRGAACGAQPVTETAANARRALGQVWDKAAQLVGGSGAPPAAQSAASSEPLSVGAESAVSPAPTAKGLETTQTACAPSAAPKAQDLRVR
jgi:hypothetical protein